MNPKARESLNEAQHVLHQVRQQKLETKFHNRANNWSRITDKCNKGFFEIFSYSKTPIFIQELHHEGCVLKTQEDLMEHSMSFYKDLYTAPEETDTAQTTCLMCLRSVPSRVSQELNEPITTQKLDSTVQQLHRNKAPCLHSILSECIKELWSEIK